MQLSLILTRPGYYDFSITPLWDNFWLLEDPRSEFWMDDQQIEVDYETLQNEKTEISS